MIGKLKKKLTNAETLGYFDTEAKTQLVTEASPVSLEFALLQIQNGENELSPMQAEVLQMWRNAIFKRM